MGGDSWLLNLCLSEGRAMQSSKLSLRGWAQDGHQPQEGPHVLPKVSLAIPDCLGGAQLSLSGAKSLK